LGDRDGFEAGLMEDDTENMQPPNTEEPAIDPSTYISEIEAYRQSQIDAGRSGVMLSIHLKRSLAAFFGAAPAVPGLHPIANLAEANAVARTLATIEATSSLQWSSALFVSELIAALHEGK
jgi:hypothetical protein